VPNLPNQLIYFLPLNVRNPSKFQLSTNNSVEFLKETIYLSYEISFAPLLKLILKELELTAEILD